jgi:pimeloyl-ACP methyl ester carboxylesterase
MNLKIMGAIIKKDALSLYPLVLLTTLLFAGDVILIRLDLLPLWESFRVPVLMLAAAMMIFGVFQLDAPVSLVDDWLCRPVPKRELLAAKLVLVFAVIYLSRIVATVAADLILHRSLAESALDAVLLQDRMLWLVLPILLLTAIVTHTFIQGFGVLIAIFVCMFVIPTPVVHAPDPLRAAIGDELSTSGMDWLATTPAKVAGIVLVALGYWLAYWRRRILQARLALAVTVLLTVFFVVFPMWLLPWRPVFAMQSSLASSDVSVNTDGIYLRNTRTCFPATRFGNVATDAAFSSARQANGLQLWSYEDLRDPGTDSAAFLSNVEPRGLPLDWRVKLNYVQADYYVGGTTPLYSLRPALYNTDTPGGSSLPHAWVLPATAVQRLKGADVSLRIHYFLTLLKPEPFSLPVDGKRHELPGLGYCSAVRENNSIDVECFSATNKPAQLSAELDEIPATRVYGGLDLAPTWVQWPFGKHVRLKIGSPRLANRGITVTSWKAAGYLDKSLALPGILGAGVDTCPLPTNEVDSFHKSVWRDAAPHEPYSISVEEGVQVEVLDFGGKGSPDNSAILLLPGLGATAHSFDEFAPLLAQKHRVIAMTRRGTGYSSKPDFGFDTPRLGQDVLEVMDALKLEKVVLVGHSIAGDELTWLGANHPERFDALVYLDAAYDRSGDRANDSSRHRELNRSLPPEPPIPPEALQNYDAMSAFLVRRGHVRVPEGELIAFFRVNNPHLAGAPNIDGRTQQAISAAIQPPNYGGVEIPALAIYAFADPAKPLPPWYDPNDQQLLATLAEIARIRDATQRESIDLFRRNAAKGQVLELRNATHQIVQSNPREVLAAIEKFVTDLPKRTNLK